MREEKLMNKPLDLIALSVPNWIDEWERFCLEILGLHCDYKKLTTPIPREGFEWFLVADKRVSTEAAYQKCQELFDCWKYTGDSLDEAVLTNDRNQTSGTYAVWLRNTVEADEIHQLKSANTLKQEGISSITLRERLVLELWYYWGTGEHLDIQSYTVCAGSRVGDDGVPLVYWDPDDRELCVGWCFPTYRCDFLRCREVVS